MLVKWKWTLFLIATQLQLILYDWITRRIRHNVFFYTDFVSLMIVYTDHRTDKGLVGFPTYQKQRENALKTLNDVKMHNYKYYVTNNSVVPFTGFTVKWNWTPVYMYINFHYMVFNIYYKNLNWIFVKVIKLIEFFFFSFHFVIFFMWGLQYISFCYFLSYMYLKISLQLITEWN